MADNPLATAFLDRAAALQDGDETRMLAAAKAFRAADCPYQEARTLILIGGTHAVTGRQAMTGLGLVP